MGIGQLIRLEATRARRAPTTGLALALFALVHGSGWAMGGSTDRLFGYAYLVSLALGFRPELRGDMRAGFTDLITVSLSTPRRYATAKVAVAAGWPVALGAGGWALALVLSGGDVEFATWHAALMGTTGALCVFPALVVDAKLGARFPVALVYLGAVMVGLGMLGSGVESQQILAWAGLDVTRGEWASLGPAGVRALMGLALGWVFVCWSVSPARRRRESAPASPLPRSGRRPPPAQ